MDLLGIIMQGGGADLVEKLTSGAGFTPEQAQKFAPEAGTAIVDGLKSHASKLDLGDLASSANVQALLGLINVGGASTKAGVSAEQGMKGLQTLLPLVLGILSKKAGGKAGLLGLLAGGKGGLGGALGGLGGMLGR